MIGVGADYRPLAGSNHHLHLNSKLTSIDPAWYAIKYRIRLGMSFPSIEKPTIGKEDFGDLIRVPSFFLLLSYSSLIFCYLPDGEPGPQVLVSNLAPGRKINLARSFIDKS